MSEDLNLRQIRKQTMNHKTAKLLSAALLSAACAQATDSGIIEIEEMTLEGTALYSDQVNALKTPTPIIDVPQSLSLYSSDTISERGFNSIGDIIDYTPGVNTSQGEGHRDAVVFRGVRSTADFFVDGVRDDVQYYRPLYNVEQVEILRGPNALLFGRGGAGGILNRVMKKAELNEYFNTFSLSIDTFGAYEAQIDSNITLGDASAFRLNAYHESFDNHRDFFDGTSNGINPTFKFQLSDKTTLDVSYEYMDQKRFIDRGIPTGDNNEPVDALNDIVFGDPDLNESTLEAHVIRAILQHQFSGTLKGNFSLSHGDYDKVYQNLYASDYDSSTNIVTLDGYLDTTERQNTILSGNLIGEFETGKIEHTLMFGAEFAVTASDQDRYNALWSDSGSDKETFFATEPLNLSGGSGINSNGNPTTVEFTTDLNDSTETDLDVYSFYLQDEIKFSEQFSLVLGARFDSFDISVKDNEIGGTDGSQKDEEFTPRAGIIYKPQQNVSIYASYSKTFLPQSGEQFADLGDEGLDPDEFTNLEAGVKWDFAQGLSLTAAIFQIDQDLVQDDGSGGSESLKTEISGFETQLQGFITDKWYVSAGYSYLEGELDSGNTPRELPENMFSLWNNYQASEPLGLGLGLIYQDESFMTNDEDTTLPSYVRIDAAAYYAINESLSLQLKVENLFDEVYYPNAHSDHQASVGAPINARLTLTGRF